LAYKIFYKKSVAKDFKKIDLSIRKRIIDKIEENLINKPKQYPVLQGRFLGLRKFRIGPYRVIFSVLDDEVWVLRVGHRKDVYNK
jgi:mRNA interferase RelE/StbE